MTTINHEPKDAPVLAQATELCRDKLGPPTPAELDRGLDAFLTRVGSAKAAPRRLVRLSLAAATAALAVLLAVQGASLVRARWPGHETPALAYRIEGGSVLEGGYLREAGHAGMNVVFNEGSSLLLTPGTRGQLRVLDHDNAHVAIERGQASFRVAHRNSRRWLVDVGPFLVKVTGTVFTVAWDPMREELDLKLREGSVLVSGPISSGEIGLRAGQHLVVNLAKVETVITEDTVEPASASSRPSGTPAVSAPELRPPAPAPPPTPFASGPAKPKPMSKLAADHQWSQQLARGQWDRILEEAERIGVDTTFGQASSEDLFALANAARYRHRLDLARSALLALRRRFPASPRALQAVYLLGRVDESQDAGLAQAVLWYDEYLSRAPTGSLAGEALGRKMTLTEKLAGPTRARPLAEEYLRRFPKGNYAGSARELLAP